MGRQARWRPGPATADGQRTVPGPGRWTGRIRADMTLSDTTRRGVGSMTESFSQGQQQAQEQGQQAFEQGKQAFEQGQQAATEAANRMASQAAEASSQAAEA